MSELDYVLGPHGEPRLILAGASVVDPDTKSGNPHHEVGSGRFGTGPGKIDRRNPQSVDRRAQLPVDANGPRPDVVRRRDAVVDAARAIQDLSNEEELRSFMRQRWAGTRPIEEGDITAFLADVRAQRLSDVVDSLYDRVQGRKLAKNKAVRVDFPRGWLKGSLAGLSDDEKRSVVDRLRARGVSSLEIRRHITSKMGDEGRRLAGA